MFRRMVNVMLPILSLLVLYSSATAQDPCSEIGSDCRQMTAAEAKALQQKLLAIKDLLPVPDADRYATDGATEASTMPFIAEAKIPNAILICRSWPAGCFVESPYNSLDFGYVKKTADSRIAKKTEDLYEASKIIEEEFENRIQVSVWLFPHPYLEYEYTMDEAKNVEESATFLSWESGEENVQLHMIFGVRTSQEEQTWMVESPAKNFAPVKSIELNISGPKAEVTTLQKRINRAALEAQLGAVLK